MVNVKRVLDVFYPEDELLGIDIGSYALKFVLFKKDRTGVVLKNWGYIPLNLTSDISPEERKAIISQEISSFVKKNQIKVKYAATSISGNSVIIRYVKIGKVEPKLLQEKIYAEAEAFIPFDINDVYLAYYVINPEVFEEGQNKMEVVLVAAKKEIIDERIEIIKEAGLIPVLIDVDSFALETLINKLEAPTNEANGVMVINMGHKVSNLSILADNIALVKAGHFAKEEYYSRLVRDIFVAGSSIDRNLAKRFSMKEDMVDEFKKTLRLLVNDEDKISAIKDFDRNLIIGSKVISSVIKELVSDIHRSVDFLLSAIPDLNITKVYISGGTSSFKGIEDYLSLELKLPVKRLDPFSFVKNPPNNLPDYIKNSLSVAAGLSLRSVKSL